MANMGSYCKAYPVERFREYSGWKEKIPVIPIKTDDSARLKISNARIAAVADKHYSTTILGSDGNLYPVDDAQIIAISDDVIAFGTKLADTYATVHDGADSGTITTLKQIDDAFAAVNKSITEGKSNRYRGK